MFARLAITESSTNAAWLLMCCNIRIAIYKKHVIQRQESVQY